MGGFYLRELHPSVGKAPFPLIWAWEGAGGLRRARSGASGECLFRGEGAGAASGS